MAFFRKKPIKPDELYRMLIAHRALVDLQRVAAVDVAAAHMGFADVESSYDVLAEGDLVEGAPTAFGLFQINTRVHKTFDPGAMGDVNYQIAFAVREVAWPIQRVIEEALRELAERRRAGEAIVYTPAKDLPQWWNLGWQFGSGALSRFLRTSTDLSADLSGFPAHRTAIGRPLGVKGEAAYLTRAARFRARYLAVERDAPQNWRDSVRSTVESSAQVGLAVAAATSGASTLAAIADRAPELPGIPDPSKLLAKLKGAATFAVAGVLLVLLLVVVLVAIEIYRARRFTREIVEPGIRRRLS